MATNPTTDLDEFERRYRDVAARIADVGYIRSGTVLQRFSKCGTPTCRCHTDPDRRHGPYWKWTAKVAGKTVTKTLTPEEAAHYQEWIANDRQLPNSPSNKSQRLERKLRGRVDSRWWWVAMDWPGCGGGRVWRRG